MESLLIKEQYKVVRVLRLGEHYAALQAVDITSRSNDRYILNVYEAELLKPYIVYFHDLKNCPDFVEMFVRNDSLVVVFSFTDGVPIDKIFYRGNKIPCGDCIDYADDLFKRALAISDQAPALSCPRLMSGQLEFNQKEKRFVLRPVIAPMDEVNERELMLLLRDQLLKILLIKFDTVKTLRKYVRQLENTDKKTVPALYSEWCEVRNQLKTDAEDYARLPLAGKAASLLLINISDFFYQIFKGRKAGR